MDRVDGRRDRDQREGKKIPSDDDTSHASTQVPLDPETSSAPLFRLYSGLTHLDERDRDFPSSPLTHTPDSERTGTSTFISETRPRSRPLIFGHESIGLGVTVHATEEGGNSVNGSPRVDGLRLFLFVVGEPPRKEVPLFPLRRVRLDHILCVLSYLKF